jgi:drug/metabolite transporter (DMT)-like permease
MSPREVGHVYLVFMMMMTVGSTVIASRLILGEPVGSVQLAGMLAVIITIALLSLPHRKRQISQ